MKIVTRKKHGTKKRTDSSDTRGKINPREIHKSFLDHIEDDLTKQGVVFFDTDTGLNIDNEYLELPREITEVSSRDLGEYLNAFTQQKVYLRTILGRAELLEEQARRNYFSSTEDLYRKYSGQKMSETAKDRVINADEDVKPLLEEYKDAKARVQMVKYAIENVEDICFLISREVTRRNADFDSENRAINVQNRRY